MLGLALLSALLIGGAVLALFAGLGRNILGSDSVKQRLDEVAPQPSLDGGVEEAGRRARGGRLGGALTGLLNRSISSQGAATTSADLARANLPLTVSEWVLLRIASVVVLFLIPTAITRQPLFGLVGAVLGFIVPGYYLSRRQSKRQVAFQDQLPDLLTMLVGSLRSGYGMTVAMDTVAKNMPAPASEEFGRVVREIGLGLSISQALANLVRRIRSDDLDLIVTAVSIQHEVGGNLANILETISDTIRERIRLKGQLRALTSQPMMTRYVLTALPLGLGGVIFLMNREYMLGLFMPGPTLLIPIGTGVLLVMGYLVMGKLAKIDM
jgi:tight adherence protein B